MKERKFNTAHLVVFDRTGRTTWDDRIWHTAETVCDRTISVWGA